MSFLWRFLKRLFTLPVQGMAYGILRPCYRCVYAKSHEPVLIFSMHRGPRVIVNLDGDTYVRTGKCIGFRECGLCFEAARGKKDLPCKWRKI
ncbi:MAG: hypothetical protein DRN15_09080 [Thermoprotei archaeon]|nr:MAG: hypothetical protein DRN15_09080 [Thermoprotei archaeon]